MRSLFILPCLSLGGRTVRSFFLTVTYPTRVMPVEADYLEIRVKDWQSTALFAVSGALALVHENREESIIF
jgi:hypothetical protein